MKESYLLDPFKIWYYSNKDINNKFIEWDFNREILVRK